MKPLDLAKKLRRDAAVDPAALDRGKAALMAVIRQEVAPARRPPSIVPQLPYHDTRAALAFLQRVFGFREIPATRIVSADGAVLHAMLEFAGGAVGIGEQGGHGTFSPMSGGVESQYVSVYVDDVDAHHERTVAAGGQIAVGLREYFWGDEGHRTYEALDPEGHRWRFHQLIRAR